MTNPAYSGQPVILVHFVVDSGATYCADIPYRPAQDEEYPNIPRVLCPLCAKPAGVARP